MSVRGPEVVGAGGVRLRTTVHGEPGAPVMVLQHGVGSSVRFLEEAVVGPVVAAGWRVALAPLRGHAGSDPVRDVAGHALPVLAADTAALVAATGAVVCGGISVAGHAAAIAVAGGATPPGVRVLAALPAWIGTTRSGVGPHAAVAAEVTAVGVRGMWGRIAGDATLRPWLRRVLVRDLAAHDEESLVAALRAIDGGAGPDEHQLRALPAGTGVVGWDGDPGHPLEVAHRWVMTAPAARLATTSIDRLDDDLASLGQAVVDAIGPPGPGTSGPAA